MVVLSVIMRKFQFTAGYVLYVHACHSSFHTHTDNSVYARLSEWWICWRFAIRRLKQLAVGGLFLKNDAP